VFDTDSMTGSGHREVAGSRARSHVELCWQRLPHHWQWYIDVSGAVWMLWHVLQSGPITSHLNTVTAITTDHLLRYQLRIETETETETRAGVRHVQRVQLNRVANFRRPPFWTLKISYKFTSQFKRRNAATRCILWICIIQCSKMRLRPGLHPGPH